MFDTLCLCVREEEWFKIAGGGRKYHMSLLLIRKRLEKLFWSHVPLGQNWLNSL